MYHKGLLRFVHLYLCNFFFFSLRYVIISTPLLYGKVARNSSLTNFVHRNYQLLTVKITVSPRSKPSMEHRQNGRDYAGDPQSERRGCFGTKSSKKRRNDIQQHTSQKHGEPKYDPIDHHRARVLSAFLALFIAFVLALVCVFAGHKPGYLESANLFTVNTSTLGHFPIDEKCRQTASGLSKRFELGNPVSEGTHAAADLVSQVGNKITSVATAAGSKATDIVPDSVEDDLHALGDKAGDLLKKIKSEFDDIKEKLDKATGSAACALKKEANELIDKAVNATGFHQFYSVHVTNWCEGYYKGGYIANSTFIPTKNVTKCSNAKRNNTFDLTDIVNKDLGSDLSIADLTKAIGNSWSKEISDHFQQVKGPLNAMVALYCIGIAWVGVGLLGVLVACFKYQTVTAAKWNMCFALVSHLADTAFPWRSFADYLV